MAARVSSRRWLLRDMPRTYVVLVWIAFGFSVLFYFSDWSPIPRGAAVQPRSQLQNTNVAKNGNNADNEKRYVGSLIVVSERGDRCLEIMLDNRTGKMWENGFFNCDQVVSQLVEDNQRGEFSTKRMHEIGKAFLGARN